MNLANAAAVAGGIQCEENKSTTTWVKYVTRMGMCASNYLLGCYYER